MWNPVDDRGFHHNMPSRWYNNSNYYYGHMSSQPFYDSGYYSGLYYEPVYRPRKYHPYYSYSNVPNSRYRYQSNVPQSYNSVSSNNKGCRNLSWERMQDSLSKHTLYTKTSKPLISKDMQRNTETNQSYKKPEASKHVSKTDFPVSASSLKINGKESGNPYATESGATVVNESNIHTLDIKLNALVSPHTGETELVNENVPSGNVIPSSQHDLVKKVEKDFSLYVAAEGNSVIQNSSDNYLSSNLSHYKPNHTKSTDNSQIASTTLILFNNEVNVHMSSRSDANMSPVSKCVKSERPNEQRLITKTEEYFDYEYSNSIPSMDIFVKCENLTHPEHSEGNDLERKICCDESIPDNSLLLDANTMEKQLSDIVQLQHVSLSGTESSEIVKEHKLQGESNTTQMLIYDCEPSSKDDKNSNVFELADESTSAASFQNFSEKANVKSALLNTKFLETDNKGLKLQNESEPQCGTKRKRKRNKPFFTNEERHIKKRYKQSVTSASSKSEPIDDKPELMSLMLQRQKVNVENRQRLEFGHSRSCAVMDRVTDECPLGHYLIPTDAIFNIRTGRITVPCHSCNILVYMESNTNFL